MRRARLGLHGAVIPQADAMRGLRAAARAGFLFYEPEVAKLLPLSRAARREVDAARKKLGIGWLPLNDIEIFGEQTALHHQEIFALAAELSIPAVTAIQARDNGSWSMERAAAALAEAARMAARQGVSLLFEPLCFKERLFCRKEEAMALAGSAGVPLVLDTFHFIVSGVSPAEAAALPPQRIGTVHVSDAMLETVSGPQPADRDRVLPGEGHLPLQEMMDAIRRTGYEGGISVEVFHPKYARRDPDEVAMDAFRRTDELMRAAGWVL